MSLHLRGLCLWYAIALPAYTHPPTILSEKAIAACSHAYHVCLAAYDLHV